MTKDYPPVGVYKHYKSTPESPRLYQVLGFARHTETEEILAVYIPLYVIPEHKGLRLQVRPLEMFISDERYMGKTVKRFTYLGPELE